MENWSIGRGQQWKREDMTLYNNLGLIWLTTVKEKGIRVNLY